MIWLRAVDEGVVHGVGLLIVGMFKIGPPPNPLLKEGGQTGFILSPGGEGQTGFLLSPGGGGTNRFRSFS